MGVNAGTRCQFRGLRELRFQAAVATAWSGSRGVLARAAVMASRGGDAVGGGGVEVAAVAAPAGEGCLGLPVPGDGLVLLGGLGVLPGDVVRPLHGGSLVNSRTCLA